MRRPASGPSSGAALRRWIDAAIRRSSSVASSRWVTAARCPAIARSDSLSTRATASPLALERRAGAVLGLHGGLARPDQRVAAVAFGQHALLADRRRLAQLARAGGPHAARARHRHAVEPIGHVLEALNDPHAGEQAACAPGDLSRSVHVVAERLGPVVRRGSRVWRGFRGPGRVRRVTGLHDQGPAAVGAGAVEQRPGGDPVPEDRGAKPPVERRGDRELVPRIDVELVGQHGGAARSRGLAA